jgi:hypothetical protein
MSTQMLNGQHQAGDIVTESEMLVLVERRQIELVDALMLELPDEYRRHDM